MDLAHVIVARLLNEEHFDIQQHPELYEPTGKKSEDGREVFRTCASCEAEHQADKQYGADVVISHGICRRHAVQQLIDAGFPPEEAKTKVLAMSRNPVADWNEVLLGTAQPAPKATFWATSGSGGV